ncbi:MAG: PQQ-dependent sugar dehydrogenase [Myxococcota bacterium]
MLLSATLGACAVLPERCAVNAPVAHMLFGRGGGTPSEDSVQSRLRVPDGFALSVWAEGVDGARFLRFTPRGDLLVSQPRRSRVVLLEADENGDGRSDGLRPLVEGLNRPHGLDLHDGWLYLGETDAVARVRFDPSSRSISGSPERVVTGLPAGGNHWTRTVRFGPDGGLYVSVGSSCNVCEEEDPRRAAMLRYEPDGSGEEIFATGLRNSVGFDWQPGSGHLYATDNGRDLLGDDFPPCELNRLERGAFYGWPVANGARVPDPDLGAGEEQRIAASRPPAHGFPAHTAPLGMTFVRGPESRGAYRDAALVALHGSWNRTRKSGYKVVSLHWRADGTIEERDFATGFEVDEDVIGRPVDVAEGPDGAFYVSDDYAGVIWRIGRGAASDAALLPTAGGAAQGTPPQDEPTGALRQERRARGAELYEAHRCYGCHEARRAEPGAVAAPLAGLGSRLSLGQIVDRLATPTPPMPLYPFDDEQRRDLAVYLQERFD